MSSRLTKTAAIVAIVFGALTIISGGRALFGGVDMGAVVPFVLWFNFLAGFAYVAAGLACGNACLGQLRCPSQSFRPPVWSLSRSWFMRAAVCLGKGAPWAQLFSAFWSGSGLPLSHIQTETR